MIRKHTIIIPLFGPLPGSFVEQVVSYIEAGFSLVLVQNNSTDDEEMAAILERLMLESSAVTTIYNYNSGGLAGGFNRGVERGIQAGTEWITLLDQDSQLSARDLRRLTEPWQAIAEQRLLVGPMIWDGRRQHMHTKKHKQELGGFPITRLLISSGTTFRAADWETLGPMNEWLIVDFVDHAWSFQAQQRGFHLLQHPKVILHQSFGQPHPNLLCHRLGMQLYSPMRHYYSLRNLRWLLRQHFVPLDLKIKEVIKMLVKPSLWLLCEGRRKENFSAIWKALTTPIPY